MMPATKNELAERFSSALSKVRFPDRTVLTVPEVAGALKVSVRHVINMIEGGKLAATNVAAGGKQQWRVPVSAYDACVLENRSGEASQRKGLS